MRDPIKIKEWLNWGIIRSHACTAAVALTHNSTWRLPRDTFRYGLPYVLVWTVAMVTVALPATLLQLSVGQLSQQDAVGAWRAVPFFRGVGYIRLLTTFLGSIYSAAYVGLTASFMFYTLSNSIPFWECRELVMTPELEEIYENVLNTTQCFNETFLAPVNEKPEYYIAVAMIVAIIWVILPFLLFSPVKSMKRSFYVLGGLVIMLGTAAVSGAGQAGNISSLYDGDDWAGLMQPFVWHAALTQALMSAQLSGGYLISVGDTVYSSANVVWTSLIFTASNVLFGWASVLCWFGISAEVRDTSLLAVLAQMYNAAEVRNMHTAWPVLVFAMLFFSGVITLLTLLYPLYDRFRRVCDRWRLLAVGCSAVGLGCSLMVLAGRESTLALLDEVAVPLLANAGITMEILALVFIYGWRTLIEDIEFLTSRRLSKFWVVGWSAGPAAALVLSTWWVVVLVLGDEPWDQPPWTSITLIITAAVAIIVFFTFAALIVARQVQYDCVAKAIISLSPSRHWGPRDPITHYYWLARREELLRGGAAPTLHSRWQLGQLSGTVSVDTLSTGREQTYDKQRSNSDDFFWTSHRKETLKSLYLDIKKNRRTKSLDWSIFSRKEKKTTIVVREFDVHFPASDSRTDDGTSKDVGKTYM